MSASAASVGPSDVSGAGDTVVAGPYQVIRDLKDSTKVKQAQQQGEGQGEQAGR